MLNFYENHQTFAILSAISNSSKAISKLRWDPKDKLTYALSNYENKTKPTIVCMIQRVSLSKISKFKHKTF